MPTDRIFRFTISGLTFLMVFVFLYSFLHQKSLNELLATQDKLTSFALAFISIPVIGVMVSTIGLGFIYIAKGHRTFVYLPDVGKPNGRFIIEKIIDENPNSEFAVLLNKELVD